MSVEKLHALASDARLLNAFESSIVPIFRRMIETKLEELRAKVRTQKLDELLPVCCDIALLKDLIDEVEMQKRMGEQAQRKLKLGE